MGVLAVEYAGSTPLFKSRPSGRTAFQMSCQSDNFGADSKSGVEPPQAKPWRASGSSRDSTALGSGLRKSVALAHPSAGQGVDVRGIDHAGVDTFTACSKGTGLWSARA